MLASLQFLLPAPPGDVEGDSVAAVLDSCLPLGAAASRHQGSMEATAVLDSCLPLDAAASRHQVSMEAPRPDTGLVQASGATPNGPLWEDSDPEAWPHSERLAAGSREVTVVSSAEEAGDERFS